MEFGRNEKGIVGRIFASRKRDLKMDGVCLVVWKQILKLDTYRLIYILAKVNSSLKETCSRRK